MMNYITSINSSYSPNNDHSKLKIRWIEIVFALLVLIIASVVVGKYVSVFLTGRELKLNIENLLVREKNKDFNQRKESVNVERLVLKKDMNGEWSLLMDGKKSSFYKVNQQDGKVVIEVVEKDTEFPLDIKIDGVGSYFDRRGIVVTDIPYFDTGEEFYVMEQEDLFPIIGYHNVYKSTSEIVDPYLDLTVEDFEEHLYLYNNSMNCRWLRLSQVMNDYVIPSVKLPRNTCVMTFDDGRQNNYSLAYPLLKKYNTTATFFIIAGRLGQKLYMTNTQLSEIYREGNDVGSHALTGGSLVNTDWYEPQPFTSENLWEQINQSKLLLESYGYNVSTFAYPLGEYNQETIDYVKKAGYHSARATKKAHTWNSPRAIASSADPEFIWHINYYEPELKFSDEILSEIAYTGLWQYEEGMVVENSRNNSVRIVSTNVPSKHSYGVVDLADSQDAIANSFVLDQQGVYQIDMYASLVPNTRGMRVAVDGETQEFILNDGKNCANVSNTKFCHYSLRTKTLSAGKHSLITENLGGNVLLDAYSISKVVRPMDTYAVYITKP